MNRSDLITRMTERLGGDRASAVAAVTGVLEEIEAGVARGERVTLSGFGTFESRARAARTARNPRTGAAVRVEASVVPVFRAATGFKSLLHPNGAADLPVIASAPVDTGVPAAVATADGKKKKKLRTAEQGAEKDGKAAKADKKARKKARKAATGKAATGKAAKKSA